MKVEIWSDLVCPFCYIGKRKFEHALEQFEHSDEIEVEWRSFELQPGLKTDGSNNQYEHLAGKRVDHGVFQTGTQPIDGNGQRGWPNL